MSEKTRNPIQPNFSTPKGVNKMTSTKNKSRQRVRLTASLWSGERGIRTLGTRKGYTGFRDRPVRPLRHLSEWLSVLYYGRLTCLRFKTGLPDEI